MAADWPAVRLDEVIDLRKGVSYQGKYLDKDGPLLLGLGTVVPGGGAKIEEARTYSGPIRESQRIKSGEMFIALTDLTQDGRVLGSPAIVPLDQEGDFAVTHHVARVVLRDGERAHPRYLYYMLMAPQARSHMRAMATGTTVRAVRPRDALGLEVRLPGLAEQRAIAQVLGALDDQIELNRRMNETLEAIAGAIFNTRFSRLTNPTDTTTPQGTAADLIEFDPPTALRRGSLAPYLGLAELPTTGPVHLAPRPRPFTSGAKFHNKDTLFARITPSLENGKTAISNGIQGDGVGWGSTEIIVMRAKPGVPYSLPYLLARDEAFRSMAAQNMTGTSGRQRVPRQALETAPVAVLSESGLKEFGGLVDPMFEAIFANALESETLTAIRDTLLPKLISGELRIPDAEDIVSEVT